MRVKRFLQCSLTAICLAGGAHAAVVNGGFELNPGVLGKTTNSLSQDVDFSTMATSGSSWGIWHQLPGWRTGIDYGVEIQTNRTLSTIDARGGGHYAELDSNGHGSIAQDLVLEAGRYVLSFWYSPRVANPWTNDISYSVGDLVSGLVGSATDGAAVGRWTLITAAFDVETSGTFALSFFAGGVEDTYGGLIDDVAVRSVSSVSIPAASLLLVTALGGFLLFRRRRAT